MHRKEMYRILHDMVGKAEAGDEAAVRGLNDDFDKLTSKIYQDPPADKEYLLYDGVRTLCVMAFVMHGRYDDCMSKARETFSRISEPKR